MVKGAGCRLSTVNVSAYISYKYDNNLRTFEISRQLT